MSPLAPLGVRGYADYQRVSNFDDVVRWNQASGLTSQVFASPIMDVSRFASIGGLLHVSTGMAFISFNWTLDAAGSITCGSRTFVMSQFVTYPMQVMMRNLGPFLQIVASPIGGANYAVNATMFPTNRVSDIDFVPTNPVLIPFATANIAAGASAVLWSQDYYAGPVQVFYGMGSAAWSVGIHYLDSSGANVQGSTINTSGTNGVSTLIAPPGAWNLAAQNNTGAAATYFVAVQHTVTGAT